MSFYPEHQRVPEKLKTTDFVLRPLRVDDAEIDFDALLSSREMLHVWDQSEWPSADFTLEENRDDLQEHESEHIARRAFTYTVLNVDEKVCLGCVYIYPLKSILENLGATNESLAKINDQDAYVTFWVRESELVRGFEARLLSTLLDWFEKQWAFSSITLGTNTEDTRQNALFEEFGFSAKWQFPIAERDTHYVIYAREEK